MTKKLIAPGITGNEWSAINDGSDDEPMMLVVAQSARAKTMLGSPRHEVAICATGDSPQAMENANATFLAGSKRVAEAAEHFLYLSSLTLLEPADYEAAMDELRAALLASGYREQD